MIKWIKEFFRKRKENEDAYWKAFTDNFNQAKFGAANALFEIIGMPHAANEMCEKCKHLAGKELTKELYLKVFELHDVRIVNAKDLEKRVDSSKLN